MRWERAVHHVGSLAQECARLASLDADFFPLRVTQLWAVGDILGAPRDLEHVTVALCVDLPAEDVAWWTEPPGAQHWIHATRVEKNPVLAWWRSARAPVWNHRIERPALVWDDTDGVRHETVRAIGAGDSEAVRSPAPEPGDLEARMKDELAVSLSELRRCTASYEDQRWRPGKLTRVSDALWRASDGYLDVLHGGAIEADVRVMDQGPPG
jgi:hypothetical protein